MFKINSKGNFDRTEKILKSFLNEEYIPLDILEKYGRKGVEALSSATPRRTGLTASSWDYAIKNKNGQYELSWYNTNIQNGLPIAIILNYGHGTSNGSYVVGRNYIEPAIAPILDEIAEEVWKEVSNI